MNPIMVRKSRVEYEGALYHVMDRGNRREVVFKDDEDRRLFVKTLGEEAACRIEPIKPLLLRTFFPSYFWPISGRRVFGGLTAIPS